MKFLLYFFPSVGKLMVGLQWGDATVLFFFFNPLFKEHDLFGFFNIYIYYLYIYLAVPDLHYGT